MKKTFKRVLSIILNLSLVLTFIVPQSAAAENTIDELNKKETTNAFVTTVVPVPAKPDDGSTIDGNINFVQIWSEVPQATNYGYESCWVNPGNSGELCSNVIETQEYTGLIRNVTAPQPSSTFWWRVKAYVGGNWQTYGPAFKLTVDSDAPVLTNVNIKSDNANSNWAKVGDKVTVSFTVNEAIAPPVVTINGNQTTIVPLTTMSYSASYFMQDTDIEGAVNFNISCTDLVGYNTQATVTSDLSKVVFDKTAPDLTLTNPTNPGMVYINEENPDVTANSNFVNVSAKWVAVPKRGDATASYDVTFTATDMAGNTDPTLSVLKAPVDLTDPARAFLVNTAVVTLLGKNPANAEWGQDFEDKGVNISWDHTTGPIVGLEVGGNLDLNRLGEGYEITYKAYDSSYLNALALSTVTSELPSGAWMATRIVNVVNTLPPKPVTDFYLVTGDSFVDLHWTNPTDADFSGVNIYRSTVSGVRGEKLGRTSKATVSYEDNTVVNGITYYYVIVALDNASPANESLPSVQIAATPIAPQLVVETTSFANDSSSFMEITTGEVKGGETDQDNVIEEDAGNNALPAVGVALLIVLGLVGLYLLYLQNPDWFAWVFFWKKREKKK